MHWTNSPNIKQNFIEYRDLMMELITSNHRAEGYLTNCHGDVLAAVIYMPTLDPHYGQVAMPAVEWLPWDVKFLRKEFLKLRSQVVELTGATQYIRVRHKDNTTQIHTLRKL